MAETTIEWTSGPRGELGYTFNGWIGCTKISLGCDRCYAAAQDKFRSWTPEGWGAGKPRKRTTAENWKKPLRWNDAAKAAGERRKVFCSSLADVFDNEVDPDWRADLFDLIAKTPNLDWLLLTKRIGNAAAMIREAVNAHWRAEPASWPLPNVWLGATVVNQEEADRDIPKLLAVPARVRFLSMEPLLGPVDLSPFVAPVCCGNPVADYGGEYMGQREVVQSCCGNPDPAPLDWVIVGGESGHQARPMHPEWVRALRDQCKGAGVPFLFKQHGEWLATALDMERADLYDNPRTYGGWVRADGSGWHRGLELGDFTKGDAHVMHIGKKAAGRLLDGVTHDGFPEVACAT